MKQGVKSRKRISLIVVVMMIISLTAMLLVNAGAINANMNVASHSVVNNSPVLTSIEAGQVWTGKNVSEAGSFGDGLNGQFTVTLSAIGGSSGAGSPIDAAGLTFNDTFTAEYAFITADSQMTFYLDGTAHTVGLTGGVYQYAEGAGTTLVEVTFDPTSNTVRYFIGQNALKTTAPGVVSGAEVYNTLVFGVRLIDEVATAGAPYNTNQPNSCTARYNTVRTNSEYVSGANTNTYKNENDSTNWETVNVIKNSTRFPGGTLQSLDRIRLFYSDTEFYEFTGSDIMFQDGSDVEIGGPGSNEWNWIVGVKAGDYTKNGDKLMISDPTDPNGYYKIQVHIWEEDDGTGYMIRYARNSHISGVLSKGTDIIGTKGFEITTFPTGDNTDAEVKVGGTTYSGTIGTYSPTSWSFTDTSTGVLVTLVDENTLTVTTATSQLLTTTETVPVTQIHDDYGIVVLEENQVEGDVTKEPEATVAGDVDVLPQTGGISTATLIGIFGLALIAVGATGFVVYRKKFLN